MPVRTYQSAYRSRRREDSFARVIAFTVAVAMALGFLVWLGWTGAGTRDALQLAAQRAVRVPELRGTIAHLNEWLIMAARLPAVSGNPRWIARYGKATPA